MKFLSDFHRCDEITCIQHSLSYWQKDAYNFIYKCDWKKIFPRKMSQDIIRYSIGHIVLLLRFRKPLFDLAVTMATVMTV